MPKALLMKTIATFPNRIEATKAIDNLRQKGINSFLADEYSNSALVVPMAEIRLMVEEADFAQAKAILAELS